MGATFPRIKNWIEEILTHADLNAEIDNILANLGPAGVDDYSTNVAQMKLQTSPGDLGTESLAVSQAGELERIRFVLARITGETYWYQIPDASLAALAASAGASLVPNKIDSGRTLSGQSQPTFLVPHGTNRTVSLKGLSTPFNYHINNVSYSVTTNVTSGTLTAAPSSNNTCTVNDAFTDVVEGTKRIGEFETTLTVDAMGSEITALVGKFAAFKTTNSSDEYFIAKVESSTALTKARRGYFFASNDQGHARVSLADNQVITLLKLTWIFVKTDGTLTQTYTNPRASFVAPTSPAIGDYWFDLGANIWKTTTNGSTWIDATALLIGMCVQDTTSTIGARSFDFFRSVEDTNTLDLEVGSTTEIHAKRPEGYVSVYGANVDFKEDFPRWNITTDLTAKDDYTGAEASSRTYYLYLTEEGDTVMSDVAPHDRRDQLRGYYHPFCAWRCVGEAFNDGSSNLYSVISYTTGAPTPPVDIINVTKTGTYTAVPENKTIMANAGGGAFAITLYNVLQNAGKRLIVKKIDNSVNAVTVSRGGSATIDGATDFILANQWDTVELLCDGTNWRVLSDPLAIAARGSRSTSQTGVNPNNSAIKMALDTAVFDTGGAGIIFSAPAMIAPSNGYYNFNGHITVSATNVTAGLYRGYVYKNGSLDTIGNGLCPGAGLAFSVEVSGTVYLAANDTLELYLFGAGDNSASTLTVLSGGLTYLAITKVH